MTALPVRFVRLPHAEGIEAPAYATRGAAGLDLAAAVEATMPVAIAPGQRALIPTGFALELPARHEGQIRPRSGLASRHGVTVLNAPGTIDEDYRGEVQVLLVNLGSKPFTITRAMRIAQLVVAPVSRVELIEAQAGLDPTARAGGGFGSTGTGKISS